MDKDKKKKENVVAPGVGIFVIIVILVALWPSIYAYLDRLLAPSLGSLNHFLPTLERFGKGTLSFFVVLSIPFSLFCLIGIVYCIEGLKRIRAREVEKFDLKVEPAFEKVPGEGNRDLSVRWDKAANLLNSQNENDWKQAILEADTMLEDVLRGLGYQGDGVGEMLKRVQPGEFKNIDDAWEAHKVRNRIAHDGSSFPMSHHEANEAIQRYKRVFEEFYYI
ncbi:MAG: hypothetical protein WCV82_02905 [Candidatus Paceibacterota bacterium]